jgi:hypothetical protein
MKWHARCRALIANSGAGGWTLPAAEVAPARLPFENDAKKVEVLMERIAQLQPLVVKQLEVFMQTRL